MPLACSACQSDLRKLHRRMLQESGLKTGDMQPFLFPKPNCTFFNQAFTVDLKARGAGGGGVLGGGGLRLMRVVR